jgi:hypothetical protein
MKGEAINDEYLNVIVFIGKIKKINILLKKSKETVASFM